jgi:multiple sugar transport system permease protein
MTTIDTPTPVTAERPPAVPLTTSSRRAWIRPVARWAAILLFAGLFGFPLYWLVTMSFKPLAEWNPPGKVYWFPDNGTLSNYEAVLNIGSGPSEEDGGEISVSDLLGGGGGSATNTSNARPFFKNSALAAGVGTLIALAIGILTAYGIARFRAGGRMLPFQILQLRMFPPIAVIIPLLFMWVYLNIWDTWYGLAILYGAVTFPFVVWLMRSFFQEVPREISEAAIVDGCTQWGAFFKAVLPQVKGGLAATALFVFILNWSDFLIALVMTQDNAKTAPVFLQSLQGGGTGQQYGIQAALAMLLILPPAIFGLAINRYLVRGLTFGAIKR